MTDTQFALLKSQTTDCLNVCKTIEKSNLESLEKTDLVEVVKHLTSSLIINSEILLDIVNNSIEISND